MDETITKSTQAEPEAEYPIEQQEPQKGVVIWQRIALGGILLISIFMNFYQLGQAGFTSYYPAAVRSMMDNWHNFFFAAYDPGGFSALDKPPVGFWLQVFSAKIFGFTPFSVLLPQATCGVLAVLLLFFLVRRQFGTTAGLLAALVLALSPISIITNRTPQVDSTLTLVLLVGAWAVLRAATTGRLRWLLLCATMIGIGFNIKMMEAYLVLPAFGLLYLLAAPMRIWKRLVHLSLALLLLLVISFSWILIVDLTPASQRPHVGSTQDNSEIGLALGYNGLQRLLGGAGSSSANPGPSPVIANPEVTPATPSQSETGLTNPTGTSGNTVPGNTVGTSGNTGPTLLDNVLPNILKNPLAGQTAWLLPLAIFGVIALMKFRRPRPRPRSDRTLQALILWGVWLLTMGIFFSVAKFFHDYYLTVMAPAIAALCGIGLVTMWQGVRGSGWRAWLLPLAIIATAAEQIYILSNFPDWGRWMIPLLVIFCLLAAGVLSGAHLPWRFTSSALWKRFLLPVLAPTLIVLVLGPMMWAAIPIFQRSEGGEPLAGPSGQTQYAGGAVQLDSALIRYLEANQGNAQILVAATGVDIDKLILATNKALMPLDGFSNYPLTTTELASLISQGKLRFLLIGQPQAIDPTQASSQQENIQAPAQQGSEQGPQTASNSGFNGASAPTGLNDVISWTTQHCQKVPSSQWQTSSTSEASRSSNPPQLYDCAAAH